MRFRLLASAVFAALVVSSSAYADTVTIASGTSTVGYTAPGGATGTAVIFAGAPYTTTVPGSQWISTTSNGLSPVGQTTFSDTFTLLAGETYTGTFSFEADDTASVLLNGTTILADNGAALFFGPNTLTITSNELVAGSNTISIVDNNTGGIGGVDFAGSFTGTPTASSVTPEPSSLLLMGTGLVGAIGAARRRFNIA